MSEAVTVSVARMEAAQPARIFSVPLSPPNFEIPLLLPISGASVGLSRFFYSPRARRASFGQQVPRYSGRKPEPPASGQSCKDVIGETGRPVIVKCFSSKS